MPITVSNLDLLDSPQALRELSDMAVPVRTALKLRKVLRAVQGELESVNDLLQKLVTKHARKTTLVADDGTTQEIVVHPKVKQGDAEVDDESRVEIADRKAYNTERESLLSVLVDLPFEKIKVSDLNDPKDPPLKLKTSLVFTLDWLLED